MKKIIVLAFVLFLAIPAAAWAGEKEYFSPAEQKEIRRTVSQVLPGCKVKFNDTEIGGVCIRVGPLRDGRFLFIPVNEGSEIFTYKLPNEYDHAVQSILKTVYDIVDNRSARDPRVLGSNLPSGLPDNN